MEGSLKRKGRTVIGGYLKFQSSRGNVTYMKTSLGCFW